MKYIFLLHLLSTLMMCGLIWFVQLVHYPLFEQVGEGGFMQYEGLHTLKTGMLVAPLMLLELGTAVLLVLMGYDQVSPMILWIGLGLIGIIWASTFFIQVPDHRALGTGWDVTTIKHLVRTNWIRTICWSARAGLMLFAISQLLPSPPKP